MAISGTCSTSEARIGNVICHKWHLTADTATSCAHPTAAIGNSGTGAVFYKEGIYGKILGAAIKNYDVVGASQPDSYNAYLMYNDEDLFHGGGVGMSVVDEVSNLTPCRAFLLADSTIQPNTDIYFWNDTLMGCGSAMGDTGSYMDIELYVQLPFSDFDSNIAPGVYSGK